jgi:hypothetical protein
MGVIPYGTHNNFARTHGIPTDPAAAAWLLLQAQASPVQLAAINERPFLVNASLGVYPELGAEPLHRVDPLSPPAGATTRRSTALRQGLVCGRERAPDVAKHRLLHLGALPGRTGHPDHQHQVLGV